CSPHRSCTKRKSKFFFSSRRRHTRSKREWSSDVCSSDLKGCQSPRGFEPPRALTPLSVFKTDPFNQTWVFLQKINNFIVNRLFRSEERRVGKENISQNRTETKM